MRNFVIMGAKSMTCDNCKFWVPVSGTTVRGVNRGLCSLAESQDDVAVHEQTRAVALGTGHAQLVTDGDFGCIQWEAGDEN